MSSHTSKSQVPLWAACVGSLVTISCSSLLLYAHHRFVVTKLEQKWIRERDAERTGRIRAEVKLRTVSKQGLNQSLPDGSTTMTLSRIGTIISPYTKRIGTPRQGALVPASRGYVDMTIPMEALDGIDQYTHAWLIFEFHANTDVAAQSKKTKIRPPRGGGIKVGQLSTRSPHRPNALGLSLVRIEKLDWKTHRLYISAFDLVNGTPIFDIKPCVPWDIPGRFDGVDLRVPDWVACDDALTEVIFTPESEHNIQQAVSNSLMDPLYTITNNGVEGAILTLKQILAQDPRSSHKRGTSTHSKEAAYNLTFCQTKVEFRIVEGIVEVMKVTPADFDGMEFVDGIPLTNASTAR